VKAWLAWSSGKDSAWALHVLRSSPDVEVVGLLTTVNEVHDRVAMHGVRRSLLQAQADALGLPLVTAPIPHPCSNEDYERIMSGAVVRARGEGVEAFAFGDLFLEDIRRYRESRLEGTGIRPLFPLWRRPTAALAEEMIAGGLRAHVVTVDPRHLAPGFAGRAFDRAFLSDLPPAVDPCGENGEFHTFAWNGPMFRRPVEMRPGVVVEREGFVFADLVPPGEA
jgi:uncharacterized protein (TIGR00290 family)